MGGVLYSQYNIKYSVTVKTAKNAKLIILNQSKYFPAFPFAFAVYSRKVIKLASEDINVPTPPILTPTSNGRQSVENFDNKIADGTLLIH